MVMDNVEYRWYVHFHPEHIHSSNLPYIVTGKRLGEIQSGCVKLMIPLHRPISTHIHKHAMTQNFNKKYKIAQYWHDSICIKHNNQKHRYKP